ncbi:MAG: peptide-methionine (S)-S-oxide reductase MsrA [Candidatus Vogelbacteria bacterium]|nr:peptide-methionine (S)-S-oxide reductase MsrA [Candidatus Vogelbacteria bacterium]
MKNEIAVFGGGCFWCTEAIFKMLNGVISAEPGYAGGTKVNPTYYDVASGSTGHAEVTRIEFDPSRISFDDLLTVFFSTHDPSSLNKQGYDVGTEYRSIVLYTSDEQKKKTEKYIADLETSHSGGRPIVTEVKPLDKFYPAEDYHKNYYDTHKGQPYCELVIDPKLEKVQQRFRELLKENKK